MKFIILYHVVKYQAAVLHIPSIKSEYREGQRINSMH
jgi:hypothetical protein